MALLPVFTAEIIAGNELLAKDFNRRYVKLAEAAINRIRERTRVLTGWAQSGWILSVNTPSNFLPPKPGEADSAFDLEAIFTFGGTARKSGLKVKPGDTIFISNNVPYIIYLENGSPTTIADRMVARTFAELNLQPL